MQPMENKIVFDERSFQRIEKKELWRTLCCPVSFWLWATLSPMFCIPLQTQESKGGSMQPMENKIVFDERSFQRIEKKEKDLGTVYHRSLWKDIVSEIKSNPVAIFAVIFLIIIIVASLLAPLSPYDPNKLDLANKFAAPSMQHPFGCDEYGRDYFTRALYGGRVSLMVGFAAMLVTVFIGTTIGIFSGYIGGKLDMLLMRFTDIFLALPSMLLMIVLNTILKPGMTTLILVLSLFSWASVARITRAETMSLKERDFVVASKNLGAGNVLIAVQHILPNILGPVIVAARACPP